MSLNFATKNWKFELTLEALHIQPLHHSSDDAASGTRQAPPRSVQDKPRVADYFLSRILVPTPSTNRKQE